MADRVEIKCVNKTDRTNPHERIHSVGGVHNGKPWKLSLDKAIAGIESGQWAFWTQGGGKVAEVIIATHLGHKYLKTTADGVHPDNLLALQECP